MNHLIGKNRFQSHFFSHQKQQIEDESIYMSYISSEYRIIKWEKRDKQTDNKIKSKDGICCFSYSR